MLKYEIIEMLQYIIEQTHTESDEMPATVDLSPSSILFAVRQAIGAIKMDQYKYEDIYIGHDGEPFCGGCHGAIETSDTYYRHCGAELGTVIEL